VLLAKEIAEIDDMRILIMISLMLFEIVIFLSLNGCSATR